MRTIDGWPILQAMRRAVCSLAIVVGLAARSAAQTCCADCNTDGTVSVDELLFTVNIALGSRPLDGCPSADLDGAGHVTIDEIVHAVRNAATGCGERPWRFRDVTAQAGVRLRFGYRGHREGAFPAVDLVGGAAAGDYDNDGWPDLYVVGGEAGPNRLLRNRADGTFEDVAAAAGVALILERHSGATFADVDGDGWLDLFIGGVEGSISRLFRNRGDGSFADVTVPSGLTFDIPTFSAAFADYDRDGDLDLAVGHWGTPVEPGQAVEHLWRNDGGVFTGASAAAGLATISTGRNDLTWLFTPNFGDIDNDRWPDLLLTSDFGTSEVFRSRHDGTFEEITTSDISDENGMGAAVGDFDGDGDLDWFVSSIHGVPHGDLLLTGNRLYRNPGDGRFEDATEVSGVRDGGWGWAACTQDFDNDGRLDIFHVNGFGYLDDVPSGSWNPDYTPYFFDRARLFIADGAGGFVDRSGELGIADPGQGRGAVCFDYDRDGDIDIFIVNNGQEARLYRNDGGNRQHYLQVELIGRAPNTQAIGARIYAAAGGVTQMRELRAGSNYLSQDPVMAHFGLGTSALVDRLRVLWPDDRETILENVAADQRLVLSAE